MNIIILCILHFKPIFRRNILLIWTVRGLPIFPLMTSHLWIFRYLTSPKKLELLAFFDFHQPHVVAIQETKIDSSVATSELFPETCPYSVFRKDRNIHGGGVMLLVHKDISHMPITELENDSEPIWVKVFANKTSHFVASWYRPPGSTSEEFKLFREQLDYIKTTGT